jgi:hypothetical protein
MGCLKPPTVTVPNGPRVGALAPTGRHSFHSWQTEMTGLPLAILRGVLYCFTPQHLWLARSKTPRLMNNRRISHVS